MIAIGMSKRDIESYSFLKLIRDRSEGRQLSGIEMEASEAVRKQSGRTPRGIFIPGDVLQTRDLSIGLTSHTGEKLVATEMKSFIDILSDAMIVKSLGATVLDGLIGDVTIPTAVTGSAVEWITEGVAATQSDPVFGQIKMWPRTCSSRTKYTRKLLIQSSISVEGFVRRDLARSLGLALDKVSLCGGGSGEPSGILDTINVNVVVMGTPDGGAPTYLKILEFESVVSGSNGLIGSNIAYLTNSAVSAKLKSLQRFATTDSPIWNNNILNGYPARVTNAIPHNLEKAASGAVLSAMIFGDWSSLIIGQWGSLDLLVNPYSESTTGNVLVSAFMDCDVAIAHEESFAVSIDIATA